jgi:hypothetical protein
MTATAVDRPPSVWEDLLEIFYAPTAVFERRRETPAFGLALIIFTVLVVGLSFAFRGMMEPVFDVEYARGAAEAIKQNPKLTPEMMAQGKAMAQKFMFVGVTVYALLAPLLLGLFLWLTGKALGSVAQLGQATMVATYAMFPRVLESILNAVQMLLLSEDGITSRYSLTLGAGRLLDATTANPLLLALAGRLDLFTLWITAILAIGIGVMGKLSGGKTIVAGAVMWLIGALPAVWQAVKAM